VSISKSATISVVARLSVPPKCSRSNASCAALRAENSISAGVNSSLTATELVDVDRLVRDLVAAAALSIMSGLQPTQP